MDTDFEENLQFVDEDEDLDEQIDALDEGF